MLREELGGLCYFSYGLPENQGQIQGLYHIHRRGAPHRPAAQLIVVVVAPALDAAAGGQRTGVLPTCGDGADAARQPAHRYRREAIRYGHRQYTQALAEARRSVEVGPRPLRIPTAACTGSAGMGKTIITPSFIVQ